MSELSQLQPQPLWDIFSDICSIPHPSCHEEALAKYIIQFTKKHGLFYERDHIGNLLIRKPATINYKHYSHIAIQAHLDMVPQKNKNIIHHFTQDSIQPWIDGKWVKARGTTLGADNGIGIASTLAVLADKNIEHGPLEVLLTIQEETGMEGALALKKNWLKSKILINTDSEKEGEIYVGCAGGAHLKVQLPLIRETVPDNYCIIHIALTGLRGGHSGSDIHLGLGNANILLTQFLENYYDILDIRLLDLHGGTLSNAIPREAFTILALPQEKVPCLYEKIYAYLENIEKKLAYIDNKPLLNIIKMRTPLKTLTKSCGKKLITLLCSIPNGVLCMSNDMKNVVETSINIGIVSTKTKEAQIHCLIRSLIDSDKIKIINMINVLGKGMGAKTTTLSNYPSWKIESHSSMKHVVHNIYRTIFNTIPHFTVIHAGLECGLFKISYPHIDMISIGPTIIGTHSPNEKVHISSVERYWTLLISLLKSNFFKK